MMGMEIAIETSTKNIVEERVWGAGQKQTSFTQKSYLQRHVLGEETQ